MEISQDVFRQEYKPVAPEVSQYMLRLKGDAQKLYDFIDKPCFPVGGREQSLAKTYLETAIMWAIKGATI